MAFVTKTNLSHPKFGSQMSQYAGMLSVAKHLNAEPVLFSQHLGTYRGVRLFGAFDLDVKIVDGPMSNFHSYKVPDVVCDHNVFNLDPNINWDLGGWFHVYQYWHMHEDYIKSVFTFKNEIQEQAARNINHVRGNEDVPVVAMHFRRGDYLREASLNLSLEYYNNALQAMTNSIGNFKLLVFSDEIDWCKSSLQYDNMVFSEGNTNYIDMCMMSLCDHNIIANSSFSWWGAYLNKNTNKVVICPEDYIGASAPTYLFINKNYYPSNWVAISL